MSWAVPPTSIRRVSLPAGVVEGKDEDASEDETALEEDAGAEEEAGREEAGAGELEEETGG